MYIMGNYAYSLVHVQTQYWHWSLYEFEALCLSGRSGSQEFTFLVSATNITLLLGYALQLIKW